MNSPMADANVAIIAELKKFMEEAVLDFSEKAKYVRETFKLMYTALFKLIAHVTQT